MYFMVRIRRIVSGLLFLVRFENLVFKLMVVKNINSR